MARQNRPKERSNKKSRQETRVTRGQEQLAADNRKKSFDNDWNLDWFEPLGRQHDIIDSINERTFTIADGSSGVGKTTTALWAALCGLRDRKYDQLIFAKNPTEAGDDKIGYLSGDEQDKLQAHYDTTKRIFHGFMSKEKLENDIASGKIRFTIPNYILGATFDNAIVLIDEAQVMSPNTMKLVLERCGLDTTYVIMGDSFQTYAISKRVDGFKDFIGKVTSIYQEQRESISDKVGYIRLTSDENRRSEGSKFITRLYEEGQV